MYLLENIRFTRTKINELFRLGLKFKWIGPDAPLVLRFVIYFIHLTPLGKMLDQYELDLMNQFNRSFLSLQRSSLIPPAYWETSVLDQFEEYVTQKRAYTLEQCIDLYKSEQTEGSKPEIWEGLYLKRIKLEEISKNF